jgi:hypothetical protein
VLRNHSASPEKNILLAAIRVDGTGGDRIAAETGEKVNWTLLREEALHQGIFPLVYRFLQDSGQAGISEDKGGKWQSLYRINTERNLRLTRKLVQILDLMASHGLSLLPIKGPVLAVQGYNDLALRQITDLDFLCRPEKAHKVFDLLVQTGFKPEFSITPKLKNYLVRTGKDIWFKNQEIQVDIQQRFPEGPPSYALKEALWEDTGWVELLNRKVPTLSRENAALILCLHGSEDGWDNLKKVADLAFFLKGSPDLDLTALMHRAGKLRMGRLLGVGLVLAREMCGFSLPHTVRKELDKDVRIEAIAQEVMERLTAENPKPSSVAFMPKVMESSADRIGYVSYFTFTPRTKDLSTCPLPDFLFPLYYLLHPARMIIKYGTSVIRPFLG